MPRPKKLDFDKLNKRVNKFFFRWFVVVNMDYVLAAAMFIMAFAVRFNPNNPILLWVETKYGYNHLLWDFILMIFAVLLVLIRPRGSFLGTILCSPLILLFIFAAQFVALPTNPTYAGEKPWVTIWLAVLGAFLVIFVFWRNYVVQELKEQNETLEAENMLLRKERDSEGKSNAIPAEL